jgi:hypothetical protein
MLLVLWLVYGSFVRLGQLWYGFGWEIQLLETGLLAAFLAHPWDPRPFARSPPTTAIVLFRWLAFRIMLGAGLIKLRGDACWTDLTCLDAHFETQPIPNPLSAGFHHAPHAIHATGVVFNHLVEVVLPWFVFGPRIPRLIAGCAMAAFQLVLIASGNLAFLNWLTLVPVLACFDDDAILRVCPARSRRWLQVRLPEPTRRDGIQLAAAIGVGLVVIAGWVRVRHDLSSNGEWACEGAIVAGLVLALLAARQLRGRRLDGHQLAIGLFAALVTVKSGVVVANLVSHHQIMNTSFDRLDLVNTYGAFGSVGDTRHELVIEGTQDPDPATATWHPYELPCKPGALDRRPCVLGPYHRRLDWLIWFAAMIPPECTAWAPPPEPDERDCRTTSEMWLLHLAFKLLDGDRSIRELIADDPFDGAKPAWLRIRRFVYHLEPYGADTWWTRDHEELWLSPVSLDTPWLVDAIAGYGWPSPSLR